MKNKAIYVFLIILIIAGAIVYTVKGLNKELNYSNRQQFEISAASTFDVSKVETIAKEVREGKWDNGEERRRRLTKAGYNYTEIQKIVNKLEKK